MKTEFLKDLGLTDEQIKSVMGENGKDIEREKSKYEQFEQEKSTLSEQLKVANEQIDKFKDIDVDALKGEIETYKSNYETAKAESESKLKELNYKHLADIKVNDIKFSSESAKKNFLNEVLGKNLPIEDDNFLGFDDFVKAFKETDPGAFIDDTKPTVPTMPPMGGTGIKSITASEMVLRSAMGLDNKGE